MLQVQAKQWALGRVSRSCPALHLLQQDQELLQACKRSGPGCRTRSEAATHGGACGSGCWLGSGPCLPDEGERSSGRWIQQPDVGCFAGGRRDAEEEGWGWLCRAAHTGLAPLLSEQAVSGLQLLSAWHPPAACTEGCDPQPGSAGAAHRLAPVGEQAMGRRRGQLTRSCCCLPHCLHRHPQHPAHQGYRHPQAPCSPCGPSSSAAPLDERASRASGAPGQAALLHRLAR
mmetsp:Transcript_18095/g.38944  ORF Transcript_18095/g.38944 Transcript_18095/m.38944 type:complete len:230 (+) Transcript_18095:51-740(+)